MDLELLKTYVDFATKFQARIAKFVEYVKTLDVDTITQSPHYMDASLLQGVAKDASLLQRAAKILTYELDYCQIRKCEFLTLVFEERYGDFQSIEIPFPLLYLESHCSDDLALWHDFWAGVSVLPALASKTWAFEIKAEMDFDACLLKAIGDEVKNMITGLQNFTKSIPVAPEWERGRVIFKFTNIRFNSFGFDFSQNTVLVRDEFDTEVAFPLLLLTSSQQEKNEFMLFNFIAEQKDKQNEGLLLNFDGKWLPKTQHNQCYKELFDSLKIALNHLTLF